MMPHECHGICVVVCHFTTKPDQNKTIEMGMVVHLYSHHLGSGDFASLCLLLSLAHSGEFQVSKRPCLKTKFYQAVMAHVFPSTREVEAGGIVIE